MNNRVVFYHLCVSERLVVSGVTSNTDPLLVPTASTGDKGE